MKRLTIINIISGLLSFLFIYTGTSKLLEHSGFLAQLQSFPLLQYHPLLFSFLIPFTELVIAFGLIINQTTRRALRASLVLLIVFTAYLVLMLFTNKDLPCPCGGIIIEQGTHASALQPLPPAALRLDIATIERLHKLGLVEISHLLSIPRSALRRRFGEHLLKRIDQALGREEEIIQPVQAVEPYGERLPCLEPIATRAGIEIALQKLLDGLCYRLQKQGKGLREAVLKCYRVDGETEEISIGTHQPSNNNMHLFKLFELKLNEIEPGLGIELFSLEAPKVEEAVAKQEKLWAESGGVEDKEIAELLDRLKGKLAGIEIKRYLPAEHYWPERSFRVAASLQEKAVIDWRKDKPRPVRLLRKPDKIGVTAPIPDYPPMLFSYKGKLLKVVKADGPERIEPEWWIEGGLHRNYYAVEDEEGKRYWIFREGHYGADKKPSWYIHGFFA